jgi:NADH-quinone oxidoreductase subunit K
LSAAGTIGLTHWLVLSAILMAIGAIGVVVRRNVLIIFMSVELMLNAANLAFVAAAHNTGAMNGQSIVFFVMTVAAAEAAVGLAVILALFRNRQTIAADEIALLKW